MHPSDDQQAPMDSPQRRPGDRDNPHSRQIDRDDYDAIHRALLTGLLSNVGTKAAQFEYTGTRGRKFHLFPGSGLFSRKPPWVMAAELTETTRLYARTVARIDPIWIERAAEHLVKRQYSEPHWERRSAHVIAYERVTLYGLIIVPRRRVHYGPIDAPASREIFIRQALVEGEYDTHAPWYRHNRQMVREVELLEAKLRRRDLLVDSQSRYDFFDPRLPATVYNGPLFEQWRRQAERKDRRILFMRKQDLMLPIPPPAPEQLPDVMRVNEIRVPLSYYFEPGDPADGVTATIPLGVLNQLPTEPFEWLVPGWLEEKIVALIKTLPKELRIPFVPAPDTARVAAANMTFGHGSLIGSLAWQLGRMTGVHVPPDAWRPEALPEWLRMNFRILDAAGKPIAMGRDLDEIRQKLKIELKETFESLTGSPWHRDGITRWDFDDLPDQVQIQRPGITLKGYPALVDKGDSVSLRLLDTPDAARQAMRGGLRRLFMLQLGQEIKYLARHLPGIERTCLNYATIGPCDELKRDIVDVAVDRALFDDEVAPLIRTREQFAARAQTGWRRLSASANDLAELVGEILASYQALSRQLGGVYPPLLEPSVRDMREQLAHLAPRGFVASTPYIWLRQMPRFLKAMELRLRKLTNAGATRDQVALAEVAPLWAAYLRRAEGHRLRGIEDPAMPEYRWMIEELRVSRFAQELKTSIPVSTKRLEGLWERIKS